MAFEVRRAEGQPGPEPLAPSSVEIRSEPEDSLAWEGFVSETGGANDSPESAQTLPAVKLNRVFGHVSRDDLIDMFRVAIAPDTSHVWILLKPASPTDYLSGQLIVLDDEGRILHNETLPPDGAELTVNIQPTKGTSQSSLVVGVLADEPPSDPSDASSPSHYELQITQEDSHDPPPPPPGGTELPPEPARGTDPFHAPPSPIVTPTVHGGLDPPSPDQDAGEIVQGEFLVGPLPVYSAGPLGGILSDSDLLQTVDRVDAALVESSGMTTRRWKYRGMERDEGADEDPVNPGRVGIGGRPGRSGRVPGPGSGLARESAPVDRRGGGRLPAGPPGIGRPGVDDGRDGVSRRSNPARATARLVAVRSHSPSTSRPSWPPACCSPTSSLSSVIAGRDVGRRLRQWLARAAG